MNPVSDLRNSTRISLLCITIACVTSMAFAVGATKREAENLQVAPSDDSREKIVRALRGAEEVKSLRIREERFFPPQHFVWLKETVKPDRSHIIEKDFESFEIGGRRYVRKGNGPLEVDATFIGDVQFIKKGNGPLERVSTFPDKPAKEPDISEDIKRISQVRFIGPETLDGIAVLAYEYDGNDASGKPIASLNKIWIRVKDGLVHRTANEMQFGSKTLKFVTTYYDYNAEIIIELPERAAREAAESWLRLVDRRRYAESWAEAAGVLRERHTEEAWEKRMKGFERQEPEFSPIKSRGVVSIESVKSLPSDHNGEGVLLSYAGSFENHHSVLQKLELVLDRDGVWRVADYIAVMGGGMGIGSGGGMGPGTGGGVGPGNGRVAGTGVAQGSSPATSVDTQPVQLNQPDPHYTEEARKNKIQGKVVVRVLVGADGLVKQVKVVRGLPDGLDEQAIQAAYRLRFKPAMKDGKAVAFWGNVHIEFNFR